jgi:hypothetical protein
MVMASALDSVWYHVTNIQAKTWQWFSGLNREEWLVLMAIVCACGFLSLRGMNSRRV